MARGPRDFCLGPEAAMWGEQVAIITVSDFLPSPTFYTRGAQFMNVSAAFQDEMHQQIPTFSRTSEIVSLDGYCVSHEIGYAARNLVSA